MNTEAELNIDLSEPKDQQTLLDRVNAYLNAGLSIIPTKQDKLPPLKEWKPYQEKAASPEQLARWFPRYQCVAIICGKISGNIELIDFDYEEKRPDIFNQWRKLVEDEHPELFKKLTIQTTQNSGYHCLYRCAEFQIPGNQVLARYNNGESPKTLIETRGEGGYFLADPSPGYKLRQGNFIDIPQITPSEREILLRCARLLNEYDTPARSPKTSSNGQNRPGLSPGDDYNERGDIRAFLEGKGWTYIGSQEDTERWRRPGKNRGSSASLLDGKTFYNFSSDVHPLEPNQSYDLFGLYTFYEHDGNFSAAAKALAQQDYGDKPAKSSSDLNHHPAWADGKAATAKQKCQLFSLNQIADCFERGVRWVWRNHIPADMPTMFSGREGDGKTTNCIQIAKEMLEQNPSDYVVWIASEGFVQDTVSKMLQLRLDGSRILFLKNDNDTFSFNFNYPPDRKQLDRQLIQYKAEDKKILACFVDSIRGITPFDDNDSKIKNVMLGLNSIVCDKHRATLIYIDHHKKGEARSALDKVVGTTAKAAAVRCVYAVTVVSGMVRKIEIAKTNILDHRPVPLKSVLSGEHGLIIYETEQADYTLKHDAQKWLIDQFSKQSEYRLGEIYELGKQYGFGEETLKKAKLDLGIDSKQEAVGKPWLWVCHRFLDK